MIQPTDNSALAEGLQEANLEKIPVIAYDQYIVNGNLTAFLIHFAAAGENSKWWEDIRRWTQSQAVKQLKSF